MMRAVSLTVLRVSTGCHETMFSAVTSHCAWHTKRSVSEQCLAWSCTAPQ
jgi:hypothetical protein